MRDETSGPNTLSGFQPEGTDSSSVGVPSADLTVVSAGSDEFIQFSDPSLLFLGAYDRQGENLVVSHEGQTHVIEGYFGSENLPALQAPNGAFLAGGTVATLAGLKFGGQFAQAGGGEPVEIGKVIKLDGTATSTNAAGVRTDLEVGTPVYQGDVIETGTGSKLGITFVDKTVFSMSAGARMVLDELVYDPNSVADSSMSFNLVQGAFVFVTGDIAPTGNMKIDTPVATMGIRGTTPKLLIDTTLGITEFSILPDPGTGDVGSYVILNKVTGAVLGTVAATGDKWIVTTLANEAVRINKTGLDLLEDQLALDEIQDVFTLAAGDRASLDGANSFTRIAFNPLSDGGPGLEATDGFGGPADGSGVVVDANPLSDDPPVAADDEFQTDLRGSSDPADTGDFDGNIVVFDNGLGVDIDPEGFPINVTEINGQPLVFDQPDGTASVTVPSGATLNVEPDGTIIYNPNAAYDFLGNGDQDIDTFTYTIADVGGQTDVGQIDVTLIGRNERPEIIFDTGSTAPLTSPFGEALTFGETSAPAIAVDAPSFPTATDLDEAFTELGTTDDTATERSVSGVMNFRDLDASDTHTTSQAAPTVVWTQDDGGTESLGEIGQLALSISATAADPSPVLTFTLDEPPVLIERPAPIDGTVEWTYTVTEADIDFLAVGETLTITYPVSVTDNSGVGGAANADGASTATEDVTITITGTNDGPQVTDQTKVADTLTETNEGLITSGSFAIIDVDTTDVVSVTGVTVAASGSGATDAQSAVPSPAALDAMFSVATDATPQTNQEIDGSSNTGTVNWTFDSGTEAFDYLAVGESLVLTYIVTVADDNGASTTQDVIITIEGTNDTPIVTEDVVVAETLAETNDGLSVTGSFNLANVLDADTTDIVSVTNIDVATSGQNTDANNAVPLLPDLDLMFTIVETGTQESEEIDNTANLGQVNWQFDSDSEAFDYLAVGESLILTYTLTISDDNNASVDQDVVITITGTNDAPVIAVDATDAATSNLTEGNSGLADTGTLSVSDLDTSDAVTVSAGDPAIDGTGSGSLPTGLDAAALGGFFTVDTAAVIDGSSNEGTVTWAFDSGGEAFNFLAVGETLELTYTVTVEDSQAATDTQDVVITITGTNDAPVIAVDATDAATSDLTEGNSGLADTGTLSVSDLDTSDAVTVSAGDPAIDGTGSGSLPTGLDAAALGRFFTVDTAAVIDGSSNEGTINWSFDSGTEAFNFLAQGETLELTYTVEVEDSQAATDTQDVVITITGTNDAPNLTVTETGSVTEDLDIIAGLISTSGTLSVTDVDVSDTHTVNAGFNNDAIWSGGTLTASQITTLKDGFAVDGTGWTFEVDNSAVQFLAAGEMITLSFDVVTDDGSGTPTATDTETVTLTINGTNDAPRLSVPVTGAADAAVSETNTGLVETDTLSVIDLDLTDVVSARVTGPPTTTGTGLGFLPTALDAATLSGFFTVPSAPVVDGLNTSGPLPWTFDSGTEAFDFLAEGETLILTYTVEVEDSQAAKAMQDVTVTITGTNDAPVLTVDTTGAVTEDMGLSTIGTVSTTGTLSIADVDASDTHTVTEAVDTAAVWSGGALTPAQVQTFEDAFSVNSSGWAFEVPNADVQFLAAGETITLSFDVTADDGSGTATATDTETVTLTINGTNDVPVLTIDDTGSVTEDTDVSAIGVISTSGTLSVADLDASDTHTVNAVSNNDATWTGGVLTASQIADLEAGFSVDGSGWTFEVPNADIQFLAAGETITLSFDVTADDGIASATDTVTITIDGANDAPTGLTPSASLTLTEDVGADSNDDISVSFVFGPAQVPGDVDATDVLSANVQYNNDISWNGPNAGTLNAGQIVALANGFQVDPSLGEYTYTVANADLQFLADGQSVTLSFNYAVEDDSGATNNASQTHTALITINGTNDSPVVTVGPPPAAVDEGDVGVLSNETFSLFSLLSEATDVDASDTPTIDESSVSFAFAAGSAVTSGPHHFLVGGTGNGTGIAVDTANYDFLASGQQAIIDVTFDVVSGGDTVSRTVQITIDGADDAPALTSGGSPLAYTQGDGAVVVDSAIALSDADNSTIIGATVQIGAGFVSRYDDLGFVAQNGITGSYNGATGTLTLSGAATVSEYEAALQSVTFGVDALASTQFGATPPVLPDDFPLTGNSTREISFTVTDGISSNTIQSAVNVMAASTTPTNGNDVLKFSSAVNVSALDGNDIIIGANGNNTINGDGGNDFISSEGGNDIINGGAGDDTISGGGGADSITGGDGADTFELFPFAANPATQILDYDEAEGDVLNLELFLSGFDPNASGEPENTIEIVETTTGNSVVSIGGTQIVTLGNSVAGDTVNVIYDSNQAAISVDVVGVVS
ncbi:MAG: VCBS domain-containing protein [Pseudomonadota bacterium]